jgi:low temperature requirement protein LtrA
MSESGPLEARALAHRVIRMTGRDPDEPHRAATPLELLFDLTFVVAFGVAAEQLAHLLADGHLASGLTGFSFAMFAVCWAWINFSWFASAYDTDDWPFRVATMVQMVGVLIFTLGLPDVFASLDQGQQVNNTVTVAGYVVMRIAMGFQWLRAATQDPARRSACLTYLATILVAQAGWVLLGPV